MKEKDRKSRSLQFCKVREMLSWGPFLFFIEDLMVESNFSWHRIEWAQAYLSFIKDLINQLLLAHGFLFLLSIVGQELILDEGPHERKACAMTVDPSSFSFIFLYYASWDPWRSLLCLYLVGHPLILNLMPTRWQRKRQSSR